MPKSGSTTDVGMGRRLARLCAALATAACAVLAGPGTAHAQQWPPPLDVQAEIIDTFTNGLGQDVVLRRGFWSKAKPKSGFGYEKILNKHRITDLGVVESIIRNPDFVNPQGGGRWAHDSIARRFVCGPRCVEVESVTVRVVIDYHGWTGPGQFGVVTAYCLNPDLAWECPDYVNTAIKA